ELGFQPPHVLLDDCVRVASEHAAYECEVLALAIEAAAEEIRLELAPKMSLERPVRPPGEVSADDHPDTVVRQQVDDAQPIQPGKKTNAVSLRDRVVSDDLLKRPMVERVHRNEHQLRVGDDLAFLLVR